MPGVVLTHLHFPLDGHQVRQDFLGVVDEPLVFQSAGNVRERTAHIGRDEIENFLRARSEPQNAQAAIEEDGPDVGRGHQIAEIGIRPAQLLDAALQLVVDGRQLFVDRLQFLLARLELFGGGTQLFVHSLKLFIRRLQLFVSRFVLLHRGVELLLENFNLVLGFDARRLCGRDRSRALRRVTLFMKKEQEKSLRLVLRAHRPDFERNHFSFAAAEIDPRRIRPDRLRGLGRSEQRRPDFEVKGRVDYLHDFRGRFAGSELEITSRALGKMDDLLRLVHHHRGRAVLLEQSQMQFAKKQFAPGLAALQVAHTVSCCFTRPVLREGGKVPDLQTKGPADRNRRLPRRGQRHVPRWPWRRTANEKPVFCVE